MAMVAQGSARSHGKTLHSHCNGWALVAIGLMAVMALILLVLCSGESSAGLLDNETPPNSPVYYNFDIAYNLSVGATPVNITFRRDGGGDFDFFRLQGLAVGDLVTMWVNPSMWAASVEYYISDPGRFPVFYYDTGGEEDRAHFNFSFLVVVDGDYFFHTAGGFGDLSISFNWTVTHGAGVPDGNDAPADAIPIEPGTDVTDQMSRVMDPSDFYTFDMPVNNTTKTYFRLTILEITGGNFEWEIYTSSGVLRPSIDYRTDILISGRGFWDYTELGARGTLYLRLWCTYGTGTIRFKVDLLDYPRDCDGIESAVEVRDGDIVEGTLNTWFDEEDFYKIALVEGDVLNLWLEVTEDLDLYVRNGENQTLVRSDEEGNVTEHIAFEMMAAGPSWIYIMVRPYGIDPLDPPVEMSYILRVRTNLDPVANPAAAGLDGVHIIYEDVPDENINLGLLFRDPEGGPLTYTIVPGHEEGRLNATVNGTRLRLVAAPNDYGFADTVAVKAVDDHGYWCVFGVHVHVKGVDDPPVFGLPPAPVTMDEDGTSPPVNLVPYFTDVDDPFWNLTITVACPPQLRVAITDGVATFTAVGLDWNGEAYCTVRATDPGGLYAEMELVVVVRPVNDAPVIKRYAPVIRAVLEPIEVDVTEYFYDVDGDALTYRLEAPGWMNATFEGGVLSIQPPEDRYSLSFNISALDPSGLMSKPMPMLVMYNSPERPPPTPVLPGEYTVEEGSALYLSNITFLYFDRPTELLLTLSAEGVSHGFAVRLLETGIAWLDGLPEWTPEKQRRTRDVQAILRYEGVEGISSNLTLTVHVLRYNRAPVVLRVGPDTSKAYHDGDEVLVFANAIDPDGDLLTFTWYLDDELQNITGNTLLIKSTDKGAHRLRVTASDGELNMTNTGSFVVLGSEATRGAWEGWTPIVVGAVVVIVVIATVTIYIQRRRGGQGTRSGGAS